ncbi:MAG: hypothetical protein IT438_14800 [Phycisphaerales bacterium]|nr:hypothetical protein [Phycisphaerales bacterium]
MGRLGGEGGAEDECGGFARGFEAADLRGGGDGRAIAGGADEIGVGDEGQRADCFDDLDVGEGVGPVFGPSADVADVVGDVGLARPGEEVEDREARGVGDLFVGELGVEVEGEALAVGLGEGGRGREWRCGRG